MLICICYAQKLAHLQSASEEERRKLEVAYKERLAAADDKLRALRHKEREFINMQKLKQRTEVRGRQLVAWKKMGAVFVLF